MKRARFEAVYKDVFPFWGSILEADREYLCQNSDIFTYPKGKNIHDGSECSGVILVHSGSLRLYMLSDEGKDITLYRLHKGDMCMLSASCVLDAITFDVFVDAEEDSKCCVISGPAFALVAERNPAVSADGGGHACPERVHVCQRIHQPYGKRRGGQSTGHAPPSV